MRQDTTIRTYAEDTTVTVTTYTRGRSVTVEVSALGVGSIYSIEITNDNGVIETEVLDEVNDESIDSNTFEVLG